MNALAFNTALLRREVESLRLDFARAHAQYLRNIERAQAGLANEPTMRMTRAEARWRRIAERFAASGVSCEAVVLSRIFDWLGEFLGRATNEHHRLGWHPATNPAVPQWLFLQAGGLLCRIFNYLIDVEADLSPVPEQQAADPKSVVMS